MKKESSSWNIAATHFLTAGFAIPFAISLIIGLVLGAVGLTAESLTTQLISRAFWLIGIWFGVVYSARYLAKKYVVSDASAITKLSTTYYVILAVIFIVGSFFLAANNPDVNLNTTAMAITATSVVIGIILFYVASKKYIIEDAAYSDIPSEQPTTNVMR